MTDDEKRRIVLPEILYGPALPPEEREYPEKEGENEFVLPATLYGPPQELEDMMAEEEPKQEGDSPITK